ncbi:6-phosphogluconolactonase [Pseudidiomarina taiwanensis]|uniref:6-phosphogluconolactonase n=1 Tax=Pseudidiomarina taiwanensis TaxID=337250 RepID=A0A432ZMY5_9GAMM|nr:6-phosphogluconolactonase [Pseudidiomarina taiwanensis]RUO79226.1 6-phosphogluconolactonase [Pseudidiomarina taiwanensis]
MSLSLQKFENEKTLVHTFAEQICKQLTAAIAERGAAYLVVSGGSTPLPLFRELRTHAIDWSAVTVVLADDRWVEPGSTASNARLVKEELLKDFAAAAKLVELVHDYASLKDAEQLAQQRLHGLPTFDVVILGMGQDAHTASLFPCSDSIHDVFSSHADIVALQPSTAPHARLTLTPKRLLDSRQIYIHFNGEAKFKVLQQALEATDPEQAPIGYFARQQQVPVASIYAA